VHHRAGHSFAAGGGVAALKLTVIEAIAAHKEAKMALYVLLRKESDLKEKFVAEHGILLGSSETLEAIEDEIDVALNTERDALHGVFQAATTLPELIAGLEYLRQLVRAGNPVMRDCGEELLEVIVQAAERIAVRVS
jgi:hypothetical protein